MSTLTLKNFSVQGEEIGLTVGGITGGDPNEGKARWWAENPRTRGGKKKSVPKRQNTCGLNLNADSFSGETGPQSDKREKTERPVARLNKTAETNHTFRGRTRTKKKGGGSGDGGGGQVPCLSRTILGLGQTEKHHLFLEPMAGSK